MTATATTVSRPYAVADMIPSHRRRPGQTIIRPVSDLQRKIKSIYELCGSTHEPVFITRNGEASLVVMDARAFEEKAGLMRAIYEREVGIRDAIRRSEQSLGAGLWVDFEEIRRDVGDDG